MSHTRILTPISLLPVELLSTALELSLEPSTGDQATQSTPYTSRLTRVVTLATVCKHWLSVIKTTSSLWRTVSTADPPSLVHWALGRWADRPLDVIVDEPWEDTETEDDILIWRPQCPVTKYSYFLERVSSHRGGWRRADLTLPDPSLLQYLPVQPQHALRSFRLDFSFRGYEGSETRRDWLQGKFCEVAPRLEYIELGPSVDLILPPGLLSGLRTLKLRPADGNTAWQRVIDALRNCPQLVHLSISTIGYCTREPINTAVVVHLPHLRSLVIRQSHLSDRLLPCIDAPQCVDYIIQTRFFDTLAGDRTRCANLCEAEHQEIRTNPHIRLTDFKTAFDKVVQRIPEDDVAFKASFFKPADIIAPEPYAAVWVESRKRPETKFRLESWGVRRPGLDAMHSWLSSALQRHYGPTTPKLALEFSGPVDEDVLQKLPQGCRIETEANELILRDVDNGASVWLAFLADHDPLQLRLPSFSRLTIRGATRLDTVAVLAMVRARYASGSGESLRSVARFEALDLGNVDMDAQQCAVWDQVKAIVGVGVLQLQPPST